MTQTLSSAKCITLPPVTRTNALKLAHMVFVRPLSDYLKSFYQGVIPKASGDPQSEKKLVSLFKKIPTELKHILHLKNLCGKLLPIRAFRFHSRTLPSGDSLVWIRTRKAKIEINEVSRHVRTYRTDKLVFPHSVSDVLIHACRNFCCTIFCDSFCSAILSAGGYSYALFFYGLSLHRNLLFWCTLPAPHLSFVCLFDFFFLCACTSESFVCCLLLEYCLSFLAGCNFPGVLRLFSEKSIQILAVLLAVFSLMRVVRIPAWLFDIAFFVSPLIVPLPAAAFCLSVLGLWSSVGAVIDWHNVASCGFPDFLQPGFCLLFPGQVEDDQAYPLYCILALFVQIKEELKSESSRGAAFSSSYVSGSSVKSTLNSRGFLTGKRGLHTICHYYFSILNLPCLNRFSRISASWIELCWMWSKVSDMSTNITKPVFPSTLCSCRSWTIWRFLSKLAAFLFYQSSSFTLDLTRPSAFCFCFSFGSVGFAVQEGFSMTLRPEESIPILSFPDCLQRAKSRNLKKSTSKISRWMQSQRKKNCLRMSSMDIQSESNFSLSPTFLAPFLSNKQSSCWAKYWIQYVRRNTNSWQLLCMVDISSFGEEYLQNKNAFHAHPHSPLDMQGVSRLQLRLKGGNPDVTFTAARKAPSTGNARGRNASSQRSYVLQDGLWLLSRGIQLLMTLRTCLRNTGMARGTRDHSPVFLAFFFLQITFMRSKPVLRGRFSRVDHCPRKFDFPNFLLSSGNGFARLKGPATLGPCGQPRLRKTLTAASLERTRDACHADSFDGRLQQQPLFKSSCDAGHADSLDGRRQQLHSKGPATLEAMLTASIKDDFNNSFRSYRFLRAGN
eukprot:284816843_3